MPYTEEEKREVQTRMYGGLWNDIFENNLKELIDFQGYEMSIIAMLSDAQFLIGGNSFDNERACQVINQVKKLTMLRNKGEI